MSASSEGLIKEYVHDLRQALGDDPRQPQFIETVHGRGYRFLGGVEEGQLARAAEAPTGQSTRPPTLAVLPFTNLTDEDRWARFCRGISDDLIIDLARYPDFMVIANGAPTEQPADSHDLCEIGRKSAAGYVVSGSVQASDNRVSRQCQNSWIRRPAITSGPTVTSESSARSLPYKATSSRRSRPPSAVFSGRIPPPGAAQAGAEAAGRPPGLRTLSLEP